MKHKPILATLASIGLLGWVAVMAVLLSQAATLTAVAINPSRPI